MRKLLLVLLALVMGFSLLGFTGAISSAQTSQPLTGMPFRPYPKLGVQVAELTPGLAVSVGIAFREGVVVLRVLPGSSADEAGLRVRDIITEVDETPVAKVNELLAAIGGKQQVTLTIARGGQELSLTVNLEPPFRPKPHQGQPFLLEELAGIEPQALFFHFLGGEFRILDREGNAYTVRVTPGLVVQATESSLTITPNGQTAAVAFSLTEETRGKKELEPGDQVVVITVDGSNEARLVLPGKQPFSWMGWGRPHHPQGESKLRLSPQRMGWGKGTRDAVPFSTEKSKGRGQRWLGAGMGYPRLGGDSLGQN